MSRGEKVNAYQAGLAIAKADSEKRLALSGVMLVHSLGALKLAFEYVSDENVKAEAEQAFVENAWEIRRQEPEETLKYVKMLGSITTDEVIKQEVKELIIKSKRDELSISDTIKRMKAHKKLIKSGFDDKERGSFGFNQ